MELVFEGVDITAPDGRPLITAASLALGPGVTAVLGGNGAGKSTMLRTLFALHPLQGGSIRFGPHDHLRNRRAFLEHSVFMPQNFTAYPELTGREFLQYFLKMRGVPVSEAKPQADAWLAAVGLEHAASQKTGTYSQGMLQRLGFAYALQSRAPLCVMDEPFAGVDPDARARLTELLFETSSQRVTLVCTHHVEEMTERGAATVRIAEGKLSWAGPATP
jgi:ABC-2 type transport system ATP-binding protein